MSIRGCLHALETPPCEACRRPLNDLNLAVIVWNRIVPAAPWKFDGLHFFHKSCPENRAYTKSYEVGQVISSARELNDLLAMLTALGEHARRREHREAWLNALLWVVRLSLEIVAAESAQGQPLDLPGRSEIAVAVARALDVTATSLPVAA